MDKNQANMWENDPSLVPDTPVSKELKDDMLFDFVQANKLDPNEWLNEEDLAKYKVWCKK